MNELITVFSVALTRRLRSRPFWLATIFGIASILGAFTLGSYLGATLGSTSRIVLAGSPALLPRAAQLIGSDFTVLERVAELPRGGPSAAWLDAHHKAGAVIFFLVSNFGVWLTPIFGYEQSVSGLLRCYTLALPFFRAMLIGDLIYVPLLFGAFFVLIHRRPLFYLYQLQVSASAAHKIRTIPRPPARLVRA